MNARPRTDNKLLQVIEATLTEEQKNATDSQPLLTKLNGWFNESYQYMIGKRARWRKNWKLYNNDIIIPYTTTKLKFNFILATIEHELSIVNDFLPVIDVVPEGMNDVFFADMMQRRKKEVSKKIKLKKIQIDTIKDSLILSDGITHLRVSKNSNGKIEYRAEVVDMFTFFPSPDAIGMDIRTEARYIIFAVPKHLDIIKREYKNVEGIGNLTGEGNLDEYGNFNIVDEQEQSDTKKDCNYALVKECYWMDENTAKYPNGRVVVWVGNIKISDEPLFSKDKVPNDIPVMPYFLVTNYKIAHNLLGTGQPELIKSAIITFNQVMSSIADNINKTGNIPRKVKRSWIANIKYKIMGIPGEQIEVNQPEDVVWDTPPSLPVSTFKFIEMMPIFFDRVIGIQDVSEGRKPTGVTAASAIMALQEAAQTRIRFKIAHEITNYVQNMGKYLVYCLQKYDKEVKDIRENISGEDKFYQYNPNDKFINTNDVSKAEKGSEGIKLRDSKLDIELAVGTRPPTGRVATEQRAIELYKEGIIGIERLAVYIMEPDKQQFIEDYYKRHGLEEANEKQEAMAEAYKEFENLSKEFMGLLSREDDEITQKDSYNLSLIKKQMEQIIAQFPEITQMPVFALLPEEIRTELVLVLASQGEETEQEDI